jgi:hypothetical protein
MYIHIPYTWYVYGKCIHMYIYHIHMYTHVHMRVYCWRMFCEFHELFVVLQMLSPHRERHMCIWILLSRSLSLALSFFLSYIHSLRALFSLSFSRARASVLSLFSFFPLLSLFSLPSLFSLLSLSFFLSRSRFCLSLSPSVRVHVSCALRFLRMAVCECRVRMA